MTNITINERTYDVSDFNARQKLLIELIKLANKKIHDIESKMKIYDDVRIALVDEVKTEILGVKGGLFGDEYEI